MTISKGVTRGDLSQPYKLDYVKVYVSGKMKGQKIHATMLKPSEAHVRYIKTSDKNNLRSDMVDSSSEWYATNIKAY